MSVNSYIQLWRCMLNNVEYEGLSLEAVVCYCVLADRHRLSKVTGYRDSNGRLCVVYPQEAIGKILRCKRKKVAKVLCELEGCGLIHRRHQGMNKADAIYVHALRVSASGTLGCAAEGHCDASDGDDINTNISKNELIDIDQIPYDINDVCIELMTQWDYRYICTLGDDIADVAGRIIDVAASMMCIKVDTMHIAGEMRNVKHVQTTIMRLTGVHIEHIATRIIDAQDSINDMYGYIATSLYNSGIQVPG